MSSLCPDEVRRIVQDQLRFFGSPEDVDRFRRYEVEPYVVERRCRYYSEGTHECWVVADDGEWQVHYATSGLAETFRWASFARGEEAVELMGMDASWCAYMVEALPEEWGIDLPGNILCGPGERERVLESGGSWAELWEDESS